MLCAFILLLGVAVFSYIMGIFIEILEKLRKINRDIDESEQLTLFFSLIKKLNSGKNVNTKFQHKIEEFFLYKWKMDKN